jgi:hypothetical protein
MVNSDKCFMCNVSPKFLHDKYSFKKGWFNREVFVFCDQCKLILNNHYGGPIWYDANDNLGAYHYALKGKIIKDLEDKEKFKKDIQESIQNRKRQENNLKAIEKRKEKARIKKAEKGWAEKRKEKNRVYNVG